MGDQDDIIDRAIRDKQIQKEVGEMMTHEKWKNQKDDVSFDAHQSVSLSSQSVFHSGKRRRRILHHGYGNLHNENDDNGRVIKPTASYIRRGLVVMPIEMTIANDTSSSAGESSAAPTYSMKQSYVALYAAFPPPPLYTTNSRIDEEFEVIQVKKLLKQYSGFYGAVGTTTATMFGQGYADSILSLNYRFPALLSIFNYATIGSLHSNIHFGQVTKNSLGGSITSLDGKTNLRLDTSNPLLDMHTDRQKGTSQLNSQQRDCTITISRNFTASSSNPICLHLMTNISPTTHFGYFSIVMTSSKVTAKKNTNNNRNKSSTISLCVGYGEGGDALSMSQLTSSSDVHSTDCGINTHKTDLTTSYGSNRSHGGARIKLDLEQPLSQTQTCRSTIEYHHAGQALSFGLMCNRAFVSSKLASVGVGIRHTFENIFSTGSKWWTRGVTSWIFQIQRGETRVVVPIKICPQVEVTPWDSVVRLCYASLATIVVDTLVAELLCDEISKLRLRFLKFVLGEESVMQSYSLLADRQEHIKAQEDESRWHLLQQISKAREEALRQRDLMKRQASIAMKKEEQLGGLIIIAATYGILDNDTGEWIDTSDKNAASKLYSMDVTTQLQFWTESSALHMSSVSKQHCMGFYDILASVSEEDWRKPDVDSKDQSRPGLFQRLRNGFGIGNPMDNRRDLIAALQVRYKWGDTEFVKMFHDNDAVDIP